jgi:hypothetical protein
MGASQLLALCALTCYLPLHFFSKIFEKNFEKFFSPKMAEKAFPGVFGPKKTFFRPKKISPQAPHPACGPQVIFAGK